MRHALRITAGRAVPAHPELTVAHEQGALRIETGGGIERRVIGGGAVEWVAGAAAPGGAAGDGSFLSVRVSAAGVCEISADRFGRRELYVEEGGGGAVAATSLDLLPIRSGVAARIDPLSMAHALAVYGLRPPKRHTYYEGVSRLGVGETLTLDGAAIARHERAFAPVTARPFGEAELNAYADTFLQILRDNGSRSGNVVYLSSGWDSTSILAGLVHVFGAKAVRAVTGRMRYSARSGVINQFEIDRATAMCEFYGVPLDFVEFDYAGGDASRLIDAWRPLFRAHQIANFTALNHAMLADAAARLVPEGTPVFAGEISDGAHNLGFSQYVTVFHPSLAFREYADKMASYLFGPTFMGLVANGQHEQDAVYQFLKARQGDLALDAPGPDVALQLLSSFFLRASRFPMASGRNARLLTRRGQDAYESAMQTAYLAATARACTPETLYSCYLHLYNSFHWQGSTVAPLALTAEAKGLTPVLPFWDARLQDMFAAMPEEAGRGLDLHPTKYPLKWMLTHRITYPMHLQTGPHSYLYDVDPGFSHSAELAHASGFTSYFRELLERRDYRDMLDEETFDMPYIELLVSGYLAGDEARGGALADLLSLCTLSMVGVYGIGAGRD